MASDQVFIDSLQLSAIVGKDCWGRSKPQQVIISVYLHLNPLFLDRAGFSDDVSDSVHYGHLTKSITRLAQSESASFASVDELAHAVSKEAFTLAGDAAVEVRMIIGLPKMILSAGGFEVDVTFPGTNKRVSVKDMALYVIIGVNPPEREARQCVVVNITFVESSTANANDQDVVGYVASVNAIRKTMEATEYLTLEKFVFEAVRLACLSSERIQEASVRAQKPSALSFAHSSGVEMTRRRSHFA